MKSPHQTSTMRLKTFDYRSPGGYFITFCTHKRVELLAEVRAGQLELNPYGQAVERQWMGLTERFPSIELDAFVVMPNHIHGVIIIRDGDGSGSNPTLQGRAGVSLSQVVWGLKTFAARDINDRRGTLGATVWQRGFYEHIIRGEGELARIREYVAANPGRWYEDRLYAMNP